LIAGEGLQNYGADNRLGRSVNPADHTTIGFLLYLPVSTAEPLYGACRSPRSRDGHVEGSAVAGHAFASPRLLPASNYGAFRPTHRIITDGP
jgi:hypothetical protein